MNIRTKTKIFKNITETRKYINDLKSQGNVVGFVPTMGALHKGHISLIEKSLEKTDKTIVSIFLNPTQFGPNEDLSKYPKTFEIDFDICNNLGVDAIFAPDVRDIYPDKNNYFNIIPPENYTNLLCGINRPGHFEGVATVVTKLFNIIPANIAFFGQKDAQQLFIIKQLVKDLFLPIEIYACPTQREPDGLACSSRNIILDSQSRKLAPKLYQTLNFIKTEYHCGNKDFNKICKIATKEHLADYQEIRLEYILAIDYNNLKITEKLKPGTLVAIAAKIGEVRLIDNILLE